MTWRDDAACLGAPLDLFQPDKPHRQQELAAFALCEGCPVRAECRAEAEAQVGADGAPFAYGVWAGEWWGERPQTRVADVLDAEDLAELVRAGWTDNQVADHYGLTQGKVREARRRWGLVHPKAA